MEPIGLQDILTLARQESARLRHYYIGVEHLFIALTRLRGGLTAAVLEEHQLSARFVRYSLRENLGRYEDRRYWPGFLDTPRALRVLALADRYAGSHAPGERELLLAILDEGNSVVSRVLREMGVEIAALRETAANWAAPLSTRPPEVPISGQVDLTADQRAVLREMFRAYRQVQVIRKLDGGYSGALVLLVRPMRIDGYFDVPVVVKLDEQHAILYERRRYDLYVKGTLPSTTARLVDAPVVPDGLALGGLKYTFVGRGEDTDPVSLRDFSPAEDPQKLSSLLRALFEVFGPAWWLQRRPYRFSVWREYEHVLPPALVIEALPGPETGTVAHILDPLGPWSRSEKVFPGEIVILKGLAVQKIDVGRDVLHLAAGPNPEAINRASKVEVRGLGLREKRHYRGEILDQVAGRVIRTRADLLLRSVQSLEPDFDLRAERLPSPVPSLGELPNPLLAVNRLLERQVMGYLSSIHGDLHLGNILVGPRGDAWLIDFAWAREGHSLFDWATLEASLLIESIAAYSAPGWGGAWATLGLLHALNRGDSVALPADDPAARAMTVVATLREIVADCLGTPQRWDEYYLALGLLALRLMDWQSASLDARRLAFLVAALCAAEVQEPHPQRLDGSWTDVTATDAEGSRTPVDDRDSLGG